MPWASHRTVEAGVPLEFLGNTDRAKSARKLIGDGHVIGSESLASPGYGGGILEIRSLKLLAEASAPPGQVSVLETLTLSLVRIIMTSLSVHNQRLRKCTYSCILILKRFKSGRKLLDAGPSV